jgi:peptide/nickel transport system permease protein
LRRYVLRRLLVAVPSLLIATFIVFALPRLLPGDVVQLMMEEKGYGKDLEELRAKLGLNRPLVVQYGTWLGHVARGDLGESLWTRQPVVTELARRLPITLTLGVFATVISIVIGVPIGIVSAVRQDGFLDFIARSSAILGLSVPAFVQAIVVILLPAIWWGWTPLVSFTRFSESPGTYFLQFLLPATILGIASAAAIMRLTRAQLLEVLRQDYVRTAWAKGLRERVVVLKHSLKNALIPVVTVLGLQVAAIAGGAVIVEVIFSIPGTGQFLVDAITQRDYPVIQGVNLVIVATVVACNLAVDVLYAALDPRIRY